MKEITAENIVERIRRDWADSDGKGTPVIEHINTWLERGDGVAVYENQDLGHPELGKRMYVSFGSEDALFPDEPPERMPDFPNQINWRYTLEGVYRGDPLPLDEPVIH